ncbi:MAG: sensor histidine kinase [Dermatophilaceae bacterium]
MTASEAGEPPGPNGIVVRRAMWRFVALSVATLAVLGGGVLVVCQQIAEVAALSEAKVRGATLARTVAAPLVDERVRERDATAMARLGAVLERSMEVGSVAHVRLWSPEGRVLWADQPALVGQTHELDPAAAGLLVSQGTIAQLSMLDHIGAGAGGADLELLEVYTGARDADGRPLLFETYYTTDEMRARERVILLAIFPVALGGLLLFQAAVMPLALSLARRVERQEHHRIRLLRQTVLTTHRERLRIARDLHDGVVQDLAGLRYALPALASYLPDAPRAQTARELLDQAGTVLARDVESLRSLLVDIYPPGLEGPALRDALEDLAERARRAGPEVSIEMPEHPDWSVDVARVAYRVVQEALRNVAAHAGATHAWVRLTRDGDALAVSVADDGRGLPPAPPDGHVGLRLLGDHLDDLAGSLDVGPRPGGGTALCARIPLDLLGEH